MGLRKLTVAFALLTALLGGIARAEEAPAPEQAQPQAGERQRLRDGSGAGPQRRQGAGDRAACDGTMRRDRLRDGSGAGGGMGAGGRGGRMGKCGKR